MGDDQNKQTLDNSYVQNNSSIKNLSPDNSQPSSATQPQTTSGAPIIPPAPTSKRINKSILIGLVILMITVVIGGMYLYLQNQSQKSQTEENSLTQEQPSPSPDPVTDWETYINSKYEYSIKYFDDGTIKQNNCGKNPNDFEAEEIFVLISKTSNMTTCYPLEWYAPVQINVHEGDLSKPNNVLEEMSQDWEISHEQIFIDGYEGRKYFLKHITQYETGCCPDFQMVRIYKNNYTYEIILGEDESTYKNLFNQILSTFEFVDQNQSTEKFTDKEFGISISYPESWNVSSGLNGGEGNGVWWEINLSNDDYFSANILKEENPNNLTPPEWFKSVEDRYNQYAKEVFQLEIDNRPAIIVGTPNSCKSSPIFVVFIQDKNKILVLTYFETSTRKNAKDLETILRNFSFGDGNIQQENIIPELKFPPAPDNVVCD
jgi:hypothetical protein